jgi:Haem-binding uptake, Tiki superfamily, ChaN
MHQAMGLLQYTMSGQKLEQEMSFRNFLSGRILWDEAMASNAYEWTNRNKGGLLVGLVGADHGESQQRPVIITV